MECWSYIEQGDIAVYSKTYSLYYKKLYNYGRKFTDNTTLIEDAIQAVFIVLWKDREKLANIYSPHSYIFQSFRNYIFKEKRKLKKIAFQKEEQEFSIDYIIINKEATFELNKQLHESLTSLTPRQREAIFLRFFEALSYDEVAQVMSISVKAAYKLMARSLLRLKELMDRSITVMIVLVMLSCYVDYICSTKKFYLCC